MSKSINFKYGYFAPRFGFEFMIHRGQYFDQRYAVSFCFIWGLIHISLPFKTRILESCDTPQYGFQIHHNTFWIHLGGKMNDWDQCDSEWITWDLPYFSWVFEDHKVQQKNGDWVLCYGDHPDKYFDPDYQYKDNRHTECYPYIYTLGSGEIQERQAIIFKEARTWHRKWFPFLKKYHEDINISFNDEVGERYGSWKGGVVGTSCETKKGESMIAAFRRFESEVKH